MRHIQLILVVLLVSACGIANFHEKDRKIKWQSVEEIVINCSLPGLAPWKFNIFNFTPRIHEKSYSEEENRNI